MVNTAEENSAPSPPKRKETINNSRQSPEESGGAGDAADGFPPNWRDESETRVQRRRDEVNEAAARVQSYGTITGDRGTETVTQDQMDDEERI